MAFQIQSLITLAQCIKDGLITVTSAGGLTVQTLTIAGALAMGVTTITGTLTVNGEINANNDVVIRDELLVGGATGLVGPVSVTGAVDLASTLKADTINEHTANAGVTVDSVKIESNTGQCSLTPSTASDYLKIGDTAMSVNSVFINANDDLAVSGESQFQELAMFNAGIWINNNSRMGITGTTAKYPSQNYSMFVEGYFQSGTDTIVGDDLILRAADSAAVMTAATTDTVDVDLNTVAAKLQLKYEATCPASGAVCDDGDVFLCKSGSNFYLYACLRSGVGGIAQFTTGY